MAVKQWLDTNLSKFMSRKLMVFIVTTVLLMVGKITEDNWMPIAVAYVGVEGFADMAIRWKQGIVGTVSKVEKVIKEVENESSAKG